MVWYWHQVTVQCISHGRSLASKSCASGDSVSSVSGPTREVSPLTISGGNASLPQVTCMGFFKSTWLYLKSIPLVNLRCILSCSDNVISLARVTKWSPFSSLLISLSPFLLFCSLYLFYISTCIKLWLEMNI